jgi:deoxyhypusine synthase
MKIFNEILLELQTEDSKNVNNTSSHVKSKNTIVFSIKDFLYEIGKRIKDENSILKLATDNNIPIFAPGIVDSMLGLQLWIFSQENDFIIDAIGDMDDLSDIVFSADKVGAILLGGGLPKHYALASNLLKGGVDSAIQITMDRSETGSLSGAPLEEAKSWSKARCGSNLVSVVGDVTILFPLILAGALDKLQD